MKTLLTMVLMCMAAVGLYAEESSAVKIIKAAKAPKPVGNYSHAVSIDLDKAKNLVFLAGQVALDPETGELMEGDIATATNRVLDNLEAILNEAGTNWANVVRVDVFLRDFNDWSGMNEEYAKRFPSGKFPARQTVEVGMEHRIEISCIAVVPRL